MILIWRGWGILVIPIFFLMLVLSVALGRALVLAGLPGYWPLVVSNVIASVVAGVAIWFIAKAISGKVVRRLVDPNTGKDVLFRRSAGSLFFIPMRYWAFIVVALGIGMSAIQVHDPKLMKPVPVPPVMQSADVQSQ